MKHNEKCSLILFLVCVVSTSGKSLLSKEVILEGKHNKTICITGDASLLRLWSFHSIIINPNWGEVNLKISSPDSSVFQFVSNAITHHVFSFVSNPIMYDVLQQQDHPTHVFVSPYGRTCVSLANPYSKNEYPMKVSIQIERNIYLFYPCIFVLSCLLFVYSRLLCTTSSFYYIFFIITSPILLPYFGICYLVNNGIPNRRISFSMNAVLWMVLVRYLCQHAPYSILISTVIQHPIGFFIYVLCCYLISFCIISYHLNKMTKKDVQLAYSMIQLYCVVFIINSTASVTVAFGSVILLTIIGFLTQKLKMTHLMKEWRIIRDYITDKNSNIISLDITDIESLRHQLLSLKLFLQTNPSYVTKLNPSLIKDYSLFVHSEQLYFPSLAFIQSIQTIIQSSSTGNVYGKQLVTSDSILLDESDENRPFFPPQPTLSISSIRQQFHDHQGSGSSLATSHQIPILHQGLDAPQYNSQSANLYSPNGLHPYTNVHNVNSNPLDNTYYQSFGPSNNMLYRRM